MKKRIILFIVLLCIVCWGTLTLGILKVNQKVNSLFTVVQELQGNWKEQGNNKSQNRCSYIPNLKSDEGWIITQFGDPLQQQEMCYTLTSPSGLVIIDGGFGYEVPRLREIIAQYGNSVEAWILTHYHPDHITAFLDIYENLQGITIHHVYTPELADVDLMKELASWDDFSMIERFEKLDIDGLEYLYPGDQVNLLGLNMNVLSAYEKGMENYTRDLMNDGSIMFKLEGEEDTFLFCADVGIGLSDILVQKYGESLKSDYVQMGHHGFGGLGEEFYRLVAPKAAFFDAPDWLVHGEGDRSTQEKERLMQDMNCVIFSYYTAPNQVLLK